MGGARGGHDSRGASPTAVESSAPPAAPLVVSLDATAGGPSLAPASALKDGPASTLGGEMTCIVCFEAPKTHLAFPCGHRCVCEGCSQLEPIARQCPVCRTAGVTYV